MKQVKNFYLTNLKMQALSIVIVLKHLLNIQVMWMIFMK